MKFLKLFIFLFLLYQAPIYAQKEDTIGLNRFFWSVIPSTLLDSYGKKVVEDYGDGYIGSSGGMQFIAGGVQFEMGNYWSLARKKRTTGYFRLTWSRIGFHNYGLLIAPAQVGFGLHVDYNKKNALEVALNGGLIIYTDDAISPDFEFNYGIYPQIKFYINRFSIGLEYTYHRYRGEPINLSYGYHYFGVVLGGRFGKRVN